MALPVGVTQLGAFKGAKGDKGLTGSLAFATAETVPADQPASVEMVGPESNRGAHFEIPRGLPGVNAVANDEATATYIAAPDSDTAAALGARYMASVTMSGPGIDPTGVTDSTVGMQAIIDAHPNGQIFIPAGVYRVTSLTMDAGQLLFGVGRSTYRDRYSTFGTAGWMNDSNFGGAIIRSTATTGTAITIVDPTEVTEGGLANLTLIGPGTGTSTGVQIGSSSPIKSTVNPQVRNVAVGNFAVGAKLAYVNEGVFDSWIFRGCASAIEFVAAVNHNVFTGLDMQWCGDGLTVSTSSYANALVGPIAQSLTGSGFVIAGSKNVIYNPYFEGIGVDTIRFTATANANRLDSPALFTGAPIRLLTGAPDNELTNVGWSGSAAKIVDEGTRTRISGKVETITGSGTGRLIIDPSSAGSPFGAWLPYTPTMGGAGWTMGNATSVAAYTKIGRTVHFRVIILFGSTTSFGSASPTVSLPTTALRRVHADAMMVRNTVGTFKMFARSTADGAATVTINGIGANGQSTVVSSTSPAAWAQGDTLEVFGTYESVS